MLGSIFLPWSLCHYSTLVMNYLLSLSSLSPALIPVLRFSGVNPRQLDKAFRQPSLTFWRAHGHTSIIALFWLIAWAYREKRRKHLSCSCRESPIVIMTNFVHTHKLHPSRTIDEALSENHPWYTQGRNATWTSFAAPPISQWDLLPFDIVYLIIQL